MRPNWHLLFEALKLNSHTAVTSPSLSPSPSLCRTRESVGLGAAKMAIAVPRRMLFIDGEWKEPVRNKRIPVVNPTTEEIIGLSLSLSSPFHVRSAHFMCSTDRLFSAAVEFVIPPVMRERSSCSHYLFMAARKLLSTVLEITFKSF